MIREKRQAIIINYLRMHGAASITELCGVLSCSGSTLRRDLLQLEQQGCLQLTHGGAVMPPGHFSHFEPSSSLAAEIAREEKEAIGTLAAQKLADGDSVIFDSSTTVREAARAALSRSLRLTAITNSLSTASLLAGAPQLDVIVPGGQVRRGTHTLLDWGGRSMLADLHADIAFIGTHTISGPMLTETSIEVAGVKRAMIAAAQKVIVLADSSKFQPPALCNICHIEEIDLLITDEGASPAEIAAIREHGVEVAMVAAGLNKAT